MAAFTNISIFNTNPGLAWLEEQLEPFTEYKRKLTISAVDVETGQVVDMTDKNTPIDQLHLAVLASASVPGAFQPTVIDGRMLMDGMAAYNTPL